MKYIAALVLVTISMVQGSILGGIGTVVGPAALKGPSSAATIVGPDGSVITSATDGGAVLAAPSLRGAISAAVAPGVVLGASPGLALGGVGTVIQGPSGIVATNGNPWGGIGVPGAGIIGPLDLGYRVLGL